MFYIHQNLCISPQTTFEKVDLDNLTEIHGNKYTAKEPTYEGIPMPMLRRMGKAVRIGVGAALPLLRNGAKTDGIIIGTANGGMEDCCKFLNQIIDYNEGTLTPTNFVQSTTNAIAGQLAMLSTNHNYNITHAHRGLAFENAMLDAAMCLNENQEATYLLGGIDEISPFNYNIESLADFFKKEDVSIETVYNTITPGTIAGEGAALFLVNNNKENAQSFVKALCMVNSDDETILAERLQSFLKTHLNEGEEIELFLSGENGDSRHTKYITKTELILNAASTIARFKHLIGEYPTTSSFSVWLATYILQTQNLPVNMIKRTGKAKTFSRILIYNHYKESQHSFILLERA